MNLIFKGLISLVVVGGTIPTVLFVMDNKKEETTVEPIKVENLAPEVLEESVVIPATTPTPEPTNEQYVVANYVEPTLTPTPEPVITPTVIPTPTPTISLTEIKEDVEQIKKEQAAVKAKQEAVDAKNAICDAAISEYQLATRAVEDYRAETERLANIAFESGGSLIQGGRNSSLIASRRLPELRRLEEIMQVKGQAAYDACI